jgi:2-polyprenyl-3-methyl-5-hydroxy-6-metoxy-1,4-benzoquinol methylase
MTRNAKPESGSSLETPWDALGPIMREPVLIHRRRFVICRPERSDHLLDHPAIRAAFAADEYLPYWTDLWPAARMLAKVIVHENWTAGAQALEIGCGLGLPGVAALAMGLRVTFSDVDPTALRFAAQNARLNGFEDFELLRMDWRQPLPGLSYPVLLASDLVYELRHINPLVALIKQALAPDGICLLTDQDRLPAYNLCDALVGEGFSFSTQVLRAGEPGGRRVKGTLYRITKRRPPRS